MDNKAQIGVTLNWIVSFLIIFFIMILFITGTVILSGKKEIVRGYSLIGQEKQSLNLLKSQRILINLLNSEVFLNGEMIKIKDLSVKWSLNNDERADIEKVIENKVLEILDFSEADCYVFYIDDNLESGKSFFVTNNSLDLTDSAVVFYIISETDKTKIGLYAGEC